VFFRYSVGDCQLWVQPDPDPHKSRNQYLVVELALATQRIVTFSPSLIFYFDYFETDDPGGQRGSFDRMEIAARGRLVETGTTYDYAVSRAGRMALVNALPL
jgi:hypothetical protein